MSEFEEKMMIGTGVLLVLIAVGVLLYEVPWVLLGLVVFVGLAYIIGHLVTVVGGWWASR